MRSAYVKAPYLFEIRDLPLRPLRDTEVLVKVKACSICGSDLHSASSQAVDWMPFGHEVAGIVERVGDQVRNVRVGDRVALESSTFCRTCDRCRNGRVDLCKDGPNTMFKDDPGGFGESMIAAMEQTLPIGDMPFEHAALLEPMGVAFDLLYTADVRLDEDVLVLGLGPIGLLALRLAKLCGARNLYAADLSTSIRRFEVAQEYGATEILATDKGGLDGLLTRGGVDKVLITAPPKTIPSALKTLNFGGIAAFLGFDYDQALTFRQAYSWRASAHTYRSHVTSPLLNAP